MMQGRKEMAAHFEHEHQSGQNQPEPEALRHVRQFRTSAAVGSNDQRFKRHAADRAASRLVSPNLGMHRAGPDRTFSRLRRVRIGASAKVSGWIGLEFNLA